MDIETQATSAVVDSVGKTDVLVPYINDKEKVPYWDGYIYVYGDKSLKKFLRRVHVQVKGKLVEKFSEGKISYEVDLPHLNHYKGEGGIIFFVVEIIKENNDINNKGDKKIFYSELLPYNITKLLDTARGEKYRNITLSEFPETESEKIELFYNFVEDLNKQQASVQFSDMFSIEKLKKHDVEINEFVFGRRVLNDTKHPIDSLLKNRTYIYADVPLNSNLNTNIRVKIPVDYVEKFTVIIRKHNNPLSIKGKIYYETYKTETTEKECKFLISNDVNFTYDFNSSMLTFNLRH